MHNNMKRVVIFNIVTIMALTLLALVPKTQSQGIVPRPLCASQFALVNYACGRLPFSPEVRPAPVSPSPPSPDDEDGHGHRHERGHGHGHDSAGDHNNNRHGHRQHRQHHHHQRTPDEESCCRWVKDVDTQCVCELLVHLPPFLVKPAHQYTLIIGEECQVTYSCGTPI